jgi:hypothetical protein
MTDRYDVMTGRNYTDRNGDQKTSWTKIGTMFATERGFRIAFDALPLPNLRDGKIEVSAVCFPPKPREEKGAGRGDLDEAAPF